MKNTKLWFTKFYNKISIFLLVIGMVNVAYSQSDSLENNVNNSDKSSGSANESTETPGKLDDMQVYGTTELETIKSKAMTVSVIDAKKYVGRFVSVDELLKRAVGVDVRRSGGTGSVSRISVRGVGGKGLKIFVDEAPVSVADGYFALDNIPIQLIERIEIYKGIAPAYLGSDALGGAINVVLIDKEVDYFESSYSIGSYGSHSGLLRFRKTWDKPGLRLSGGLVTSYAKNNYDMDISFVGKAFDGLTVEREHNEWYWAGWGLALAFTKLWFDEIELEFEGVAQMQEKQGIYQPTVSAESKSLLPVIGFSMEKEDFFLDGLDFNYNLGVLPLSISRNIDTTHISRQWPGSGQKDSYQRELIGETGMFPHGSRDTLQGVQQRINISYELNSNHTFNLNDVFQYMKNKPSDSIGDAAIPLRDGVQYKSSSYPAKLTSNTLGLAWEWTLLDDRFLNQLGAKMHYLKAEVFGTGMYQVDMLTGIPKKGQNDSYHWGFSEAIRYKLTPSTSFKTSYEYAVRLPDKAELFGNSADIGPGIGLKPEKSHNVNVGLSFVKDGWLDMPHVEAEVNGFYYDTDDKIKLEPGVFMMVYQNVQHARTLGVEVDIKADVRDWLYLTANATYQDIRDVDGYKGNITKGERLPNDPWFFANLGAEFTKHDLFRDGNKGKLFWEGGYTHEFYYTWKITANQFDLIESAFIMNTGVEYGFSDRLTISAEVDDILDKWKADEYRMPLPGRTFKANVHLFLQKRASDKKNQS